MKAAILAIDPPLGCEPTTSTRSLGDCLVANRTLLDWQKSTLGHAGCTVVEAIEQAEICMRGDAWLCVADLELLMAFETGSVLLDSEGMPLAWLGSSCEPSRGASSANAGCASFRIRFAWDFLRINQVLVGALSEDRVEGTISSGVNIEGHITLGPGSRLLPGVFIEGNAVIGSDCKIGPNCYIRGETSLGDGCHIGQAVEIKNSILYPNVGVGHLSYCGDSIIGERANFGAGTITANFRHDGANHRSMVGGELVDTGRRKFGSIVGDDVHTGIHTSIYPGRKLWPHSSTRPGEIVQSDLKG